ncbi:MAG: hypothetical protein HY843_08270 [Bdellovibrio sp.]|nr:hypothetical protein [Bdellovibrio sp.]
MKAKTLKNRKTSENSYSSKKLLTLIALISSLLIVTLGCGEQGFKVTPSTTFQKAPGSFSLPPKIDILLAEDNTGSMFEFFDSINYQFPRFLMDLDSKGWDYHFAVTPLTTTRPFGQIAASFFDPSWGSQWTPPFPGVSLQTGGLIPTGKLTTAKDFSNFLSMGDISNISGGREPGLETIYQTLTTLTPGTGFVRNDALLVIVVVGNGKDTSGVNLCNRQTGTPPQTDLEWRTAEYIDYCETTGFQIYQNYNSSLLDYQNKYINFKKLNPSDTTAPIKFFAGVAKDNTSSCKKDGVSAYAGQRYKDFERTLNNKTIDFDICTQELNTFTDAIASHLNTVKLQVRQKYVPLPFEPEVSSIKVIKYIGGDVNQAIEISKNETNGWTYAGFINDYAIDYPFPSTKISAFAIELHGSARLFGEDTAKVESKPKGARDSGTP